MRKSERESMQKKLLLAAAIFNSVLLVGCGGGGGGNNDTTAPTISSVSVSSSSAGQITLTASATDNTGVTGYCFKSTATAPLANEACFQTSASNTITAPQTSAMYVWAKDAAGNISAQMQAGCFAAGVSASQASSLPTVCVST